MKIELKEFQSEAVDLLVHRLHQAQLLVRTGGSEQAVVLSSPTGSGKTAMVTAAIERILEGDDDHAPQPDATFLWITDQPELNLQTRGKLLATSTALGPFRLVVIDAASFDEPRLPPGKVYFLNTQKLGRDKQFVTPSDDRSFTIWQSISRTVEEAGDRLFVIIDEAHRGMNEGPKARAEASTIIQKFVKGSAGEIPPIPVILGVSATPAKFNDVLAGTDRGTQPCAVPPEAVRESGLIKEKVRFHHPTESQPVDMTMLHAAARAWKEYESTWTAYTTANKIDSVAPVLVVQVRDGKGKTISATSLEAAIAAIEDEVGFLPDVAYAHAFQEGTDVTVGNRVVRYLSPSSIDGDGYVQVVFFKTSLNTGWDCPRAEVMMSFRTAKDATLIAQLVGRMVRTPLARRIDEVEKLNTVALFLPHFDEKELKSVVATLTADDPTIMPPTEVEEGAEVVTLHRRSGTDDCFALLESLPTYVIPRVARPKQTRRLMKMAHHLADDGLLDGAFDDARTLLLDTLRAALDVARSTAEFKALVDDIGELSLRIYEWRYGTADGTTDSLAVKASSENVDELFAHAGRKIGEGLHKVLWRDLVDCGGNVRVAKLHVTALLAMPGVVDNVETTAGDRVRDWLTTYKPKYRKLSEPQRQAYEEIAGLAVESELGALAFPTSIEGRVSAASWDKHLYVNPDDRYPANFNTWETEVLNLELARDDVVGWLRNPDRKPYSICVPYELGGQVRGLYPDFVFVRETDHGLVADILDPHRIDLVDAAPKAAALAKFADKHASDFGRVELIIKDGDELHRLDLGSEAVRAKVREVTTAEHLRALYGSMT